ncbi:MAG: hypothetical protein HC783_01370 [Rhodobacteraceae bacterium]|nr:hypothetical protein [Paracoccaceae bacterium]
MSARNLEVNATSALMKAMPPLQWLSLGTNLAATLTAAWYGFSFGYGLGGAFIGVVAAVTSA